MGDAFAVIISENFLKLKKETDLQLQNTENP